MKALLLLLALGAYKPDFDEAYFDKCYENESADICSSRQTRWRDSMERYRQELAAELKDKLDALKQAADEVKIEPTAGAAKVGPMAPRWCKSVKAPDGSFSVGGLRRNIENFNEGSQGFGFSQALYAARTMCVLPDNPDMQRLAGALVQSVVNTVGYSADDAVTDLTLRLDEERFAKSKKSLCAQLEVSPEADGLARVRAQATSDFFGCAYPDNVDSVLWGDSGEAHQDDLVYFLDTGFEVPSETMRLTWLLLNIGNLEELPNRPHRIMRHPMVQPDLDAFDPKKVEQELSAPPFADNPWARAVLLESLGYYRVQAPRYIEAIAALTKADEGVNEVLIEAPKRAVKAWAERTARFKDVLDHSAAFEEKAFGPSRKAVKGCAPELRKDFGAYLKTVKAKPSDFTQAVVSDPVGNLLLFRLAACEAAEGHAAFAGVLRDTLARGRLMRGKRLAALYGALEALGPIREDRPRFRLQPTDARAPRNDELFARFREGFELMSANDYERDSLGSVVQRVAKQGDKARVVFISKKLTYPAHDCWDTKKIMGIDSNGNVRYYRECSFGKRMVTVTEHLDDAVFSADLGAAIKPGAWVDIARSPNSTIPLGVYPNDKRQKLLAWRGFAL